MADGAPRPDQHRLRGILFRIGATTGFGVMAAMIKLGYDRGVSTPELVFYRFSIGLIPLIAWILATGNHRAWRTANPGAHVTRGLIGLATMMFAFSALDYLPLAEATTIGFAAPLFAVALSALVLGEQVGLHRWSAVVAGLAGVLIVMQPQRGEMPVAGLLIALAGAFGTACVTITIRRISRTEGTQTIVLWFTLFAVAASGLLMPFFARAHDGGTWMILTGLGLAGGTAQILLTASLRHAPVSVVAPFDYAQLLWAVLFGWLIWEAYPLPSTWAGAAVIVASGLYTVHRERRIGRERKREEAAL